MGFHKQCRREFWIFDPLPLWLNVVIWSALIYVYFRRPPIPESIDKIFVRSKFFHECVHTFYQMYISRCLGRKYVIYSQNSSYNRTFLEFTQNISLFVYHQPATPSPFWFLWTICKKPIPSSSTWSMDDPLRSNLNILWKTPMNFYSISSSVFIK